MTNCEPINSAIPESVHSKSRIAQPMVREGWLKHGPGASEGRGREPFVPVSWDKALDLVAGEIERVRREHGNAAIMGGSQGWGSAGIFHDARTQVRRFLGAFGGYTDQASNYSFGAALTFLPHVLGSAQVHHEEERKHLQVASLDHAMWFMRPFRADEWLLYDQSSPSASGGRALTQGKIFTRSGEMVAAVMQEGLTRYKRDFAPARE
jgi:hypothetical protein